MQPKTQSSDALVNEYLENRKVKNRLDYRVFLRAEGLSIYIIRKIHARRKENGLMDFCINNGGAWLATPQDVQEWVESGRHLSGI